MVRRIKQGTHRPKLVVLPLVLVIGTAGCAMPAPSGVVSNPGAPPRSVNIVLTSELKYTPFSPEQLANPAVQSIIAQCERQRYKLCRGTKAPADSRTQFVRTRDQEVIVMVTLGGLELDRDYNVGWRLFDSVRQLRTRLTFPIHIPPEFRPGSTVSYFFNWSPIEPATWQLGRWRFEIFVNGQKEAERSFDVVEPTS